MADVTINGILLTVTFVRIEKSGSSWVVYAAGGSNLGYADSRNEAIGVRDKIVATHNASVYAATRITDTFLVVEVR